MVKKGGRKNMVIRKNKKNKLAVRDKDKKTDIATRRPYDLWTDMDRLFDSFKSNFDDLFWNPTTALAERTPPMDIADLGDKYEMHVEMPGIPKDNINIEVTSNNIEISAEHKEQKDDKGKDWIRRERSSTSFYRCLEVPEELKTDKVDAELRDGILRLTLPKLEPKEKQKSKKIKIK
jgi:HSP20 family protein